MRIKWRCDGCIVDKNWIPGGTGKAVGTGQLHGVAARWHDQRVDVLSQVQECHSNK